MSGKHTLRDDDPDRWGQGDDFSDEDFKNPYEDREPDRGMTPIREELGHLPNRATP
jgi:hypothetical protein